MRSRCRVLTRALIIVGIVAAVPLTVACGIDQRQGDPANQPQENSTTIHASENEPATSNPGSVAASEAVEEDTTTQPPKNGAVAQLEERLGSLTHNHDDKHMLEIAKRVPEWGGYFVRDEIVHVYLTDMTNVEGTKSALADELSNIEVRGRWADDGIVYERGLLGRPVSAEELVVEEGQFTMLQLLEWFWLTDFQASFSQSGSGVTGMAVYESENRLGLNLEAEEHRDGAATKLEGMGIPVEAVRFSVTGLVPVLPH
jgi:hypothetical protein